MQCRVSDQTSCASAIGAIDIPVQLVDGDCDTQGIKKIIYILLFYYFICFNSSITLEINSFLSSDKVSIFSDNLMLDIISELSTNDL